MLCTGGSEGTVGLYLLQATDTSYPSLGVYALDSEEGMELLVQGAELRSGKRGARYHEASATHVAILSLSSLLESA